MERSLPFHLNFVASTYAASFANGNARAGSAVADVENQMERTKHTGDEKILQASVNLLEKSLSEVSQAYLQNLSQNYNCNRVPYTSKNPIPKKHVKL